MEPHSVSVTAPFDRLACTYVLHASEHLDDCFLYRLPMPRVKLITDMADFANCYGLVSSLWIDARLTWRLHGFSMLQALEPQENIQVYIYNCEYLAPEVSDFYHPQLHFIKAGIHPAMFESNVSLRT